MVSNKADLQSMSTIAVGSRLKSAARATASHLVLMRSPLATVDITNNLEE